MGLLLTYVDDILVAAERRLAWKIMNLITSTWTCSTPEDLDVVKRVTFCSMRITKLPDGDYHIDQEPYIKEVLERHNLLDVKPNVVPIQ